MYQINKLCNLNLCSVMCQLSLNKAGGGVGNEEARVQVNPLPASVRIQWEVSGVHPGCRPSPEPAHGNTLISSVQPPEHKKKKRKLMSSPHFNIYMLVKQNL